MFRSHMSGLGRWRSLGFCVWDPLGSLCSKWFSWFDAWRRLLIGAVDTYTMPVKQFDSYTMPVCSWLLSTQFDTYTMPV
jgi:hypothetical protein